MITNRESLIPPSYEFFRVLFDVAQRGKFNRDKYFVYPSCSTFMELTAIDVIKKQPAQYLLSKLSHLCKAP